MPPEISISSVLTEAGRRLARIKDQTRDHPFGVSDSTTLRQLEEILAEAGLEPTEFLAEGTLEAFRKTGLVKERRKRASLEFLVADGRPIEQLTFTHDDSKTKLALDPKRVRDAVVAANQVIELINDVSQANGAPIFQLLGMRNLSSFIGEIMASELNRVMPGQVRPNPNQDGHPDLIALTPEGIQYIEAIEKAGQMSAKNNWSPYPHGGIEVKATCGSTPPATKLAKPQIGESRWPLLIGADWKAHHQETNNLLAVYWDFVDGIPTILAVFYRNDLTANDWGAVITPGEGSRTTSVSIMKKGRAGVEEGVKKMAKGWIVLPRDDEILKALSRRRVFDLSKKDIEGQRSGNS